MRFRVGLAVALALSCALPAHAARDVFVRDSPRSAVATCLRATGAPGVVGLLGPLERRMTPYDLLRVSAGGVDVAATARLGVLDVCPAVAAAPTGHAVVAGVVRTRGLRSVVRATLAEPGGAFGAPVDLGRTRYGSTRVAVAVSPRGDAVVAWTVERGLNVRRLRAGATRILAAIRPAGGAFGPPKPLTPWRRGGLGEGPSLGVGMDASGTATVAWSQPIPDRGNIPDLSAIEAAAAPPGGSFGAAQVVARPVQDVSRVALAVAPDGRALLAHDGQGAIQVHERLPGESQFARIRRLRPRRYDEWRAPEVAVTSEGSALVAWRGGQQDLTADVLISSRRGTGAWTAVQALHRSPEDDGSLGGVFVLTSGGGQPGPPLDDEGTDLRVAMGPDGRYLVGWAMERTLALGDSPLAVRMADGQAGAGPGPREAAGCTCRSVTGQVPLALADGTLVIAYTDNVTRSFGFGFELPSRDGRLHLAELGPPGLGPSPPGVSIRRPRPATLDYGDALRVRVRCDAACDLRTYVVGRRGRARGLGGATLRAAGATRIAIRPDFNHHLAAPTGGARVVVHAYAPNGRDFRRRSVPVELHRMPLRPLPRVLDARAVRQGRFVIATWRTDRPARRASFDVRGRPSGRIPIPLDQRFVEGGGRTRFRVRLRTPRQLREFGEIEKVAIRVRRDRPPFDVRTVVVPVVG